MSHGVPPRSRPYRGPAYSTNARLNQNAWKRMTVTERDLGKTVEQIRAEHADQRARVLKRYGLAA